MKKYPLLDIFRVVCACLVALIHKGAAEESFAGMLLASFSRQAVPFFFMVSGFFFARKLENTENNKQYVFDYAKRMLIFYGVWMLIQFPQLLEDYIPLYRESHWLYLVVVLARRVLLAGTAPFWYLLALAETALVAGLLLIHRKDKLLYWIAGIGLLAGYLYPLPLPSAVFKLYQNLVYTIFSWNNNFIMMGIPFFSIGIFFAKNLHALSLSLRKSVCAYLFISSISILCYILQSRTNFDIGTYLSLGAPQAVLLFMIGISAGNIRVPDKICGTCRDLSSAIYCLHFFVIIDIMGDIIPWTGSFFINFVLIIAVCVLTYFVVKITKIRPLYRLLTLK